jgi:hypothetical protein
MVDRTADFLNARANRHQGVGGAGHPGTGASPPPPPPPREPFTAEGSKLVAALHRMERFLRRTFRRYVNPLRVDAFYRRVAPTIVGSAVGHPSGGGAGMLPFMSDADREDFDENMENFARRCSATLGAMRGHAQATPARSEQQQEHRRLVAQYLEARVLRLVNVWQKMISLRAKELMRATVRLEMGVLSDDTRGEEEKSLAGQRHGVDGDEGDAGIMRRRHNRRERRERRRKVLRAAKSCKEDDDTRVGVDPASGDTDSSGLTGGADGGGGSDSGRASEQLSDEMDDHNNASTSDRRKVNDDMFTTGAIVLEESSEDVAALSADAAMLERALETDVDAAQELEKQFANLAEMTKMFTQQIDEQHEMVNTIHEDTEDAKDFLDKGVDELNKAKVGRGKHFLSIIFAVLSFVLLFLDWFTP